MRNQKQNRQVATSLKTFACAMGAGVGMLAMSNHAQATVVVHDNFAFTGSGSQYAAQKLGTETADGITGWTPDVTNLPGNTWQHMSGAYYDAYVINRPNPPFTINPGSWAGFHNGGGSGLSLGAYNTGSLTIGGNIYFVPTTDQNNVPNPVNAGANLEMGFTSTVNSNSNYGPLSTTNVFTGLQLFGDGSVQEFVGGVAVGMPIAFTGTYDPTTPTAFSYTINTATGAISNVSLAGSTSTYSFATGVFLNSDTAFAELGGSGNDGGATANIKSFEISTAAVPEPASISLLAVGSLALAMRRRRQAAAPQQA